MESRVNDKKQIKNIKFYAKKYVKVAFNLPQKESISHSLLLLLLFLQNAISIRCLFE